MKHLLNVRNNLNSIREQGVVVEGQTVEELAEKIGANPKVLAETVETWNASVESKKDEAFGRETAMDYKVSKSPYLAVQIYPGIHHTMGGIKINTNTEVLKEDGSSIKGLYAAGEVTGDVHGHNRIGGNAAADIIIFCKQAGLQATKFVQ